MNLHATFQKAAAMGQGTHNTAACGGHLIVQMFDQEQPHHDRKFGCGPFAGPHGMWIRAGLGSLFFWWHEQWHAQFRLLVHYQTNETGHAITSSCLWKFVHMCYVRMRTCTQAFLDSWIARFQKQEGCLLFLASLSFLGFNLWQKVELVLSFWEAKLSQDFDIEPSYTVMVYIDAIICSGPMWLWHKQILMVYWVMVYIVMVYTVWAI